MVWRLHEQTEGRNLQSKTYKKKLSIVKGRSMCPHCHHELAAIDLIPVLSWLSLQGKCRYCRKAVSVQYPLIELATAFLFVVSYNWWPTSLHTGLHITTFILWLALLVGLMALVVYDLRWLLLPNQLIYPLSVIALVQAGIGVTTAQKPFIAFINAILAVLLGGGIFYFIFQISKGKWIGGGDVRLGWLLGLIVGTPAKSLLFIFIAAVGGSLISLPLMATGKLKRTSIVPFGPLLIMGAVIVVLFGTDILNWYQRTFITY